MNFFINNPALSWFLAGIIFLALEYLIPGFVIFFFGVGAIFTAALTMLGITQSFNLQVVVFLLSSLGTLVLFRNKGKKYFKGGYDKAKEEGSLADEIIGEKSIVAEEINPAALTGKIELHGTMWNATAEDIIAKGAAVQIIGRKDLTLIVKKITNEPHTNG